MPGPFPSPRKFAYKQLRGHNRKGTAGQNGKGAGVNEGINPEEFSMHYIKVDGSGGLLAKHKVTPLIKISQCIGMHPYYRLLLSVKWRDQYFVGFAKPSSVRSGHFISISVADTAESNLLNKQNLSDLMHIIRCVHHGGISSVSPMC